MCLDPSSWILLPGSFFLDPSSWILLPGSFFLDPSSRLKTVFLMFLPLFRLILNKVKSCFLKFERCFKTVLILKNVYNCINAIAGARMAGKISK